MATGCVVIFGERRYVNHEVIVGRLNKMLPNIKASDSTILTGGEEGVCEIVRAWAFQNKLPLIVCDPDWDEHGKAAYFRRNNYALDGADSVVTFWDGKPGYLKSLIDEAFERGLNCVVRKIKPSSREDVNSWETEKQRLSEFLPQWKKLYRVAEIANTTKKYSPRCQTKSSINLSTSSGQVKNTSP